MKNLQRRFRFELKVTYVSLTWWDPMSKLNLTHEHTFSIEKTYNKEILRRNSKLKTLIILQISVTELVGLSCRLKNSPHNHSIATSENRKELYFLISSYDSDCKFGIEMIVVIIIWMELTVCETLFVKKICKRKILQFVLILHSLCIIKNLKTD